MDGRDIDRFEELGYEVEIVFGGVEKLFVSTNLIHRMY